MDMRMIGHEQAEKFRQQGLRLWRGEWCVASPSMTSINPHLLGIAVEADSSKSHPLELPHCCTWFAVPWDY
jgi:hypothetical protein